MSMEISGDIVRAQAVAVGVTHAPPAGGTTQRGARAVPARLTGWLLAACLVAGSWQLGQGAYIHAKARLAQYLIADAWNKTLAGQRAVKPWPWADTWPVARILAPSSAEQLYVLAGADGRTIAFGPGHLHGTPLPGTAGNSVIGGHRDTHFAFLRDLKHGDELTVQRADSALYRYRVSDMQVVDKSDVYVARNGGDTRLTLVTCWPFDALRAGGPQRYVVTAITTVP
jgi:sortase A